MNGMKYIRPAASRQSGKGRAGGTVLGGQIPALTVFCQPSGHMDVEVNIEEKWQRFSKNTCQNMYPVIK